MEELEEEDSGEEDEEEMEGEEWDEDEEGGTREFVEDDSDLEEEMSDLEDWSGEEGEEVSLSCFFLSFDASVLEDVSLTSSLPSSSLCCSMVPNRRKDQRRRTRSQWTSLHSPRIPKESERLSLLPRRRRVPLLLRRRPRRVELDLGWRLSTSRRWRRSR